MSPLTEQFRFCGRDQVRALLAVAFDVLTDIRFHTQVGEGATYALFATASIGAQQAEEAQLLRLDRNGNIRHLTLFFRPLPALTGLLAALGPGLAQQQHRPALARLLAVSSAAARDGACRRTPRRTPRRSET